MPLFGPTEAAEMLQAAPKDRPPEFVVAFVVFTRTNLVVNSIGFTGLAPECVVIRHALQHRSMMHAHLARVCLSTSPKCAFLHAAEPGSCTGIDCVFYLPTVS